MTRINRRPNPAARAFGPWSGGPTTGSMEFVGERGTVIVGPDGRRRSPDVIPRSHLDLGDLPNLLAAEHEQVAAAERRAAWRAFFAPVAADAGAVVADRQQTRARRVGMEWKQSLLPLSSHAGIPD